MGRGTSKTGGGSRATGSESWRDENPKYQEKTLGGVYFYQDRNDAIAGEGSIDRQLYDRLPQYAQRSVIQLWTNGVSTSGWFAVEGGVAYMNHDNPDFLYEVRRHRRDWVDANGFRGSPDNHVVVEWVT